MIPAWYAAAGMVTTGLIGAVGTHLAGAGRKARLLKRTTRVVAELRRLTAWTPPTQHWEAGMREDRWSLPVSPRLTDRPRIQAAKAAAMEGSTSPVATGSNWQQIEVRHAAPAPDVDWHRGEHRIYSWGWAVEVVQRFASIGAKANVPLATEQYKPRHLRSVGEVTQEFRRIIAAEWVGGWRCDSCAVGRDGEPSHISCVGCSCPCAVAELPEGVEGHALAGGTR